MVMAREQTKGKGRHGRTWISPPGLGLYVSYLVFPKWPTSRSTELNEIAVLATAQSLLTFEPDLAASLEIFKPNDLLIGGKKVSGILVETGFRGEEIQWAIIGIGVNTGQTSFKQGDFRKEPTSLALEDVEIPSLLELCRVLTRQLEVNYLAVVDGGAESVQGAYGNFLR
jgi:BirA family biotin operon repressor/biotin-[acetyl-CoA-carboxylase] ligase